MITVVCLCVCRSVCYKATTSIHMHTHICKRIATNKPGSKIIQIVSPYINMVRINTIIVQICHVCNGHSVNCVHFACREANNVNNDLALFVRGYVVRWLKYYCTFRMTHMYCENGPYLEYSNYNLNIHHVASTWAQNISCRLNAASIATK